MATLRRKQGRAEEARQLYEQSVGEWEQAFGASHPALATTLDSLASLRQADGHPEEAEPLAQRALEIRQQALEPEHPDLAYSFNTLSTIRQAQGRYEEAESLSLQSVEVASKSLGASHPDLEHFINSLSWVALLEADAVKAASIYQRAMEILVPVLGAGHPGISKLQHYLAVASQKMPGNDNADPDPKQQRYQRVLAMAAQSMNHRALIDMNLGKYAAAEELFKSALAIYEKTLGPNHPDMVMVLDNYAVLLHRMGKTHEAAAMTSRADSVRTIHH